MYGYVLYTNWEYMVHPHVVSKKRVCVSRPELGKSHILSLLLGDYCIYHRACPLP